MTLSVLQDNLKEQTEAAPQEEPSAVEAAGE